MKINLNKTIKVKLTDFGKSVLYASIASIYEDCPDRTYAHKHTQDYYNMKINTDDDGFQEFSIHEFCNIFGGDMIMGSKPVIEGNDIFIEDKEPA